jgi:hypothetical protein
MITMIISIFSMYFRKVLFPGIALLCVAAVSIAQSAAVSPVALGDARFQGATEDWTTPALGTSHLIPIRPVEMVDNSHSGYTLELLQMQWRLGDPFDLYVMKPKGVKKPPVILYLFSFSSDTDLFKNDAFQQEVTKDGFAAVCFVSALSGHRFHDRPMKEWFISELQESLAESAHDVQMILNFLAGRGDFNMDEVGMIGHGSGGSIGILASAVDPRIKVLDVLDPWGDWPTWMASSPVILLENERREYVAAEFLKKAEMLEPVDWLPKVQARKFRFQDAVYETRTPKVAKEKLRAAAPPGTAFVFYKDLEELQVAFPKDSMNLGWIEHELSMLPQTAGPPASHPSAAQAATVSNK